MPSSHQLRRVTLMLMAWSSHSDPLRPLQMHASPINGGVALCGEKVNNYGDAWPHLEPDGPEHSSESEICIYCLRLMRDG